MVHISENNRRLTITKHNVKNLRELQYSLEEFDNVCFLQLPITREKYNRYPLKDLGNLVLKISQKFSNNATLIIYGEVVDLVHIHEIVEKQLNYQLWIAIKQNSSFSSSTNNHIPTQHLGALVYTKYEGHLRHTKTRLVYTYCPVCSKTTKDYGGKKHTYHPAGTLISDVWKDFSNERDDMEQIFERFADLFGTEQYNEMRIYDLSTLLTKRERIKKPKISLNRYKGKIESRLIKGDCLEELRRLPENSIDFAFADPPYNLKKNYHGYNDDLDIAEYFRWCDEWIYEVARVLRPGGTFAILNIPLWSIRHFLHLERVLEFQNWIVWDALSFPVRMIMPAHYSILCFSKGKARSIPGLTNSI